MAYDRVYSGHHVHHFTRKSLELLLADHGLLVERHIDHDAPIGAMDIPVSSKLVDSVLRFGLRMLWFAGRLTRRSYLQTVIVRNAHPA